MVLLGWDTTSDGSSIAYRCYERKDQKRHIWCAGDGQPCAVDVALIRPQDLHPQLGDIPGWRAAYVHRHFKRSLTIAELPTTFRIHDLRHSAATFMVARGVHPKIVAGILGHTKIALTMDLYAHSTLESVREAAKIVADWLEEADTSK